MMFPHIISVLLTLWLNGGTVSSFEWINDQNLTYSIVESQGATLFTLTTCWYFNSDTPYTEYSVKRVEDDSDVMLVSGGVVYDILSNSVNMSNECPPVTAEKQYVVSMELTVSDASVAKKDYYCLVTVGSAQQSTPWITPAPSNPHLTDPPQAVNADIDYTYEPTETTVQVSPKSINPPVQVFFYDDQDVLVEICQASASGVASCSHTYTNPGDNGKVILFRGGTSSEAKPLTLKEDAGGCKAICYVLIAFAVILIVAVIVFFILAFIKGIAELRCHGLTKLLIALLVFIIIFAVVVLILLIVQGVGDDGFAGSIGKAGLALGIIGFILAVFVIGFVLVVIKIMGGKGTGTQKGTDSNGENGTNLNGNKNRNVTSASSVIPAISSSQTETKPRSTSPKNNQVSPGEKPPGE